jgi:hypothetical protein
MKFLPMLQLVEQLILLSFHVVTLRHYYRCQPRGPGVEKPGFFKKIRGRGPDRKPRRGRGFLFVHILY